MKPMLCLKLVTTAVMIFGLPFTTEMYCFVSYVYQN